jgi:hypothetical protein
VAEETGIRSSLSLQLFTDEEHNGLGALNLYSPHVTAFDAETRGEGLAFAAQAAVALRSAQTEEALGREQCSGGRGAVLPPRVWSGRT